MDYSYFGAEFAGLFAGMIVVFIVAIIFSSVIALFHIIGIWKILKKANQPGWASLIPFYREYLLCKISGVNPWWILICICAPILHVIPVIGSLVAFLLAIYFVILLSVSIARSFGKDDSYAVGLILLAPFFYFALGISDATYKGETPMDDVILSKVMDISSNNSSKANKDKDVAYCSSCGSKISSGTKFCPNCGNEIK